MTTLHLRQSIIRSLLRCGLLLTTSALFCFALVSTVRAVNPAPDGGYPGANTAEGTDALLHLTTGSDNTAIGFNALFSNRSGHDNTATGFYALINNTTGYANTAIGVVALSSNTTGYDNTAIGVQALNNNNAGVNNTATGFAALGNNTTGANNTANGFWALRFNETGFQNTATGLEALQSNTTGFRNTADGSFALYNNTGSNNVGLGYNAGLNLTTGGGNVCIGSNVLGVAGESNTTRIRNVYTSVASGRAVYVNSDHKLGTLVSSRRFKEEIKSMDKASEAILALKPVTFRYKKEIESSGDIMFGLIAEEVEKVDPCLVIRNDKGEAESVRYEAVNAMLLNEFLKEHRKVEKQAATISQLNSTVAQQQKDFQATVEQLTRRLDEQASQIQKVSAQVAVNGQARQMISSNQ
jgi:Chaperone of endosialidase